jgi:hypothetical protein
LTKVELKARQLEHEFSLVNMNRKSDAVITYIRTLASVFASVCAHLDLMDQLKVRVHLI